MCPFFFRLCTTSNPSSSKTRSLFLLQHPSSISTSIFVWVWSDRDDWGWFGLSSSSLFSARQPDKSHFGRDFNLKKIKENHQWQKDLQYQKNWVYFNLSTISASFKLFEQKLKRFKIKAPNSFVDPSSISELNSLETISSRNSATSYSAKSAFSLNHWTVASGIQFAMALHK